MQRLCYYLNILCCVVPFVCLFGWLVGCLVVWLFGCLVGSLVGWLVSCVLLLCYFVSWFVCLLA